MFRVFLRFWRVGIYGSKIFDGVVVIVDLVRIILRGE